MAEKLVLIIFLAMLLFTEHSMAIDDIDPRTLDPLCVAKCALKCRTKPLCYAKCITKCAISLDGLSDEDESGLRVCNVGCSLGHCSEFLFHYDEKMFGTCMAGCRENHCVGMIKMEV